MDATGFPLDKAILIGIISGSILYGAYVVFFFTALYVLIGGRKTPKPNWLLVGIAVCMFILSTIIEALSWSRVLDAFIVYRNALTPDGYFADISNWKEVTRTALLCIYLLCADFALLYRCWIVWMRRVVIVAFPLCLFVGNIAAVFGTIITMARSTSSSVFDESIAHWVNAVIAGSLAENIIVTSLIVFRIVRVSRASSKYSSGVGTRLAAVVPVIVESGLLFVTGQFIFQVCYATQSNAQWIMVDCMNGIIGLAFTMMIVRIGLGLSGSQPRSSEALPMSIPVKHSTPRASQSKSIVIDRHVEVERISTQEVESDSDAEATKMGRGGNDCGSIV